MKTSIFNLTITFPATIKHYTDLPSEVNPIPNDSIIYKSITGIGATFSEVVANRNSIIVFPNVSIVKAKQKDHEERGHNTFAIFGEISREKVLEYIQNTPGNKKFFTTPKGIDKVMWSLEKEGNITYDGYFILMDECHKQISDAKYREDLLVGMEYFFKFKQRAMVSATPLPPSDPRFTGNDFKHIKLQPEHTERHSVRLIHANSVTDSLNNLIVETGEEQYFIFFNSMNGIKSLVDSLSIGSDSSVFCSHENAHTFKTEFLSIHSTFECERLRKFNFFTSSFYNGLDMNLDSLATVIIITDHGFAPHSLVDPQTDVIQILGRFRNGVKQALHINNCKRWTRKVTEEDALQRITFSHHNYDFLNALKKCVTVSYENITWLEQMQERTYPYSTFFDKYREFSHFKQDNYLHEIRTKNHYRSPYGLKMGYLKLANGDDANLFEISEDNLEFEPENLIRLSGRHSKYRRKNIKEFVTLMAQIEELQGTDEYNHAHELINRYIPKVYEAYTKLGIEAIIEYGYRIKKIKLALIKFDYDQKRNSNAMIEAVYNEFKLHSTYTVAFIKEKLQALYTFFKIEKTAVATDIEHYFVAYPCNKSIKGESHRAYSFRDFKFALLPKYNRN